MTPATPRVWNKSVFFNILSGAMEKTGISVIKQLFSSDSYETGPYEFVDPPGKKLSVYKTACFYKSFIGVILDARKQVVRGEYSSGRLIQSSFQVMKNLEKAGAKFSIKGLDNIRKAEGPVVIAANHMSTLETAVFPCIIGLFKDCTFVVKKSLIKGPVFGPVMRFLEPVDVERKDPKKDLAAVMIKGAELIGKGKSIVLFPQATRARGFNPAAFNSLGVKLAKRAGVSVVPCALKTDFWENGKIISTIGKLYPERIVHMEFGKPLAVEGAGRKEQEAIVSFIRSRVDAWKQPI